MDGRDTNRSVTLQENHTQITSVQSATEPIGNRVVGNNSTPSTTTLSTIAIRAGDHATIVVALLKSLGFIELRIAEMKPRLLAIGGSIEETSALLNIHEDLMARLKDKKDQVSILLTRADNLGAEKKDPKEAVVYYAMSKSLSQAWNELNKQLLLRGYLLKETLSFYRMAHHHEQVKFNLFNFKSGTINNPYS
uniref:Pentatricopeptide repeat-containing protein n=1 Tax=Heterorhabditis bacteriophora TaxID=37862 RepID=A0A1I7XK83_HETBA